MLVRVKSTVPDGFVGFYGLHRRRLGDEPWEIDDTKAEDAKPDDMPLAFSNKWMEPAEAVAAPLQVPEAAQVPEPIDEEPQWPEKTAQGFQDSSGELFDATKHHISDGADAPSVNVDGTFRKKRSKIQ